MLAFRDLTVSSPRNEIVISDFSSEFALGEHVLISGDPGAAIKLFKVVSGLWPWGRGQVDLPNDAAIFFMPQRPYLPIGRLRSAVSYPAGPTAFDDDVLTAALERVGLDHLLPRLEHTDAWEKILTAAEQQRLGFARLLLHRPNWIFIQEATDALDPVGEADFMQMLQEEFREATGGKFVGNKHLDFNLRDVLDRIFGPAIGVGMASLTSKPLDLIGRKPLNPNGCQSIPDVIKQERANDSRDNFHVYLPKF